jgi:predicted nucleic acid-binding protein
LGFTGNPKDKLHATARRASAGIGSAPPVTTDEVLSEFLTFYSRFGPALRKNASTMVHEIRVDSNVRVLPQTRLSFDSGFHLYENRVDKKYSLTDCISMQSMRIHDWHESAHQRPSLRTRRVYDLDQVDRLIVADGRQVRITSA